MITELQNSTGSGGPIYDVEFHPHEFLLAGGSHDRTVHFWDLEKFALIGADDTAVMSPATGPVRCIYFHPEGDCLFSGTVDGLRVHGWEPSRTFDSLGLGCSRNTIIWIKLFVSRNMIFLWALHFHEISPNEVVSRFFN
jgi:katanin p80 WD40 repeat-containing subunit B1